MLTSWLTGAWLTRQRLTVYPRMILALYAIVGVLWIALSVDSIDSKGKPLGYDFITFWSASDLALEGRPADAYDHAKLIVSQRKAVPALTDEVIFLWHYPPTFQLLTLPLALVPYLLSFALFVGLTFVLYLAAMRGLVTVPQEYRSGFWWLLLAFPGVFINIFQDRKSTRLNSSH